MKKKDLMNKKQEELADLLIASKKNLFNLQSASLAGEDSQKKKARIPGVRKDIARIKTRLNNS